MSTLQHRVTTHWRLALAELIDNSLRATKANRQQPRSITVSLVTDDKAQHGMVCVRDNGSGMDVQELSNWAVMNLSMEDKGLLKAEEGKSEWQPDSQQSFT